MTNQFNGRIICKCDEPKSSWFTCDTVVFNIDIVNLTKFAKITKEVLYRNKIKLAK